MGSVAHAAAAPAPSSSHRRTRLRPGDVVASAYEVEHLVGQGASGEVWSVREISTHARFALKVLAADAATDDETVERFRREAYFLARAESEHVARIHDFVFDPEMGEGVGMALVMELVEGEPLAVALDQRTLSVEEAIELGMDLLAGVEVLHAARIIHRDLKPGNVILRAQRDGRPRPVICDFGLSRQARRREGDSLSAPSLTELTKGNMTLGTLRYMAPEQVLNARQATEQSDLYAVGAILYRAVTGVHAFGEHEEPRAMARAKVMGEAPAFETGRDDPMARALEEVVTRALRRRPSERHEDARQMREALARAAEQVPARMQESVTQRISLPDVLEALAPAVSPAPAPATVPARRRKSPVALVAAAVLMFAAGIAADRAWTWGARPAGAPVAAASTPRIGQTPGIEAAVALPEIAELPASPTPTATAAPPPAAPLAVASLPRDPRPAPVAEPSTGDDNPY